MPDDDDVSDALDFATPCRDDKCKIVGAHAAHPMPPDKRRPVITTCPEPECGAPLIRMAGTRGLCSKCPWRGSIAVDRGDDDVPIMKKIQKLRKRGNHA